MLLSGAPGMLLLAVSHAVNIHRAEAVPILVGLVLDIHAEVTQTAIARVSLLLPDPQAMDAMPGN